MHWLARVILYEAFSPGSAAALTWFSKTHSCSFILAFLYRYDHHSMSITMLTNRNCETTYSSFRPCKLNTFVPLLVNSIMLFFCDRYLLKFDLLLLCDTSSFEFLSLEHVG